MKLKRVAVVGPAGSGRSFLINSLLGSKHVEHAVRASPVTLDISSHRDVVEVNGRRVVLELVDTPGFCGQGVILEEVQRDLKTKFKHIDKVVIVIAKGRLEPTDKNEIRSVLQFLDYKNNPEKIMIVINDRRENGINQQQKENDLSNILHMLGVEDYSIVNSKTQMSPLLPAVSLSNDEERIFHSEIEMIQEFLLKETTTQDPIIQVRNSAGMTSRNVFSAQSMALLVLATALVFGFLLNSYMGASVKNYIEEMETGNIKLEEEAVSQKSNIEQLEIYQKRLKEEAVSDKKNIATLETDITELKEEADSDKKQKARLEKDQTKLKEEAESNKEIISTLETDLTELKEEADVFCKNYTEKMKMQKKEIESDLFICQNNIGLTAILAAILAVLLIVNTFVLKNKSVSVVTSEIQPLLDHPAQGHDRLIPQEQSIQASIIVRSFIPIVASVIQTFRQRLQYWVQQNQQLEKSCITESTKKEVEYTTDAELDDDQPSSTTKPAAGSHSNINC